MSVLNLGDPELELIDPTPNIHALFLHFDKTFFWEKLSSRAVVRWSKRMYSCAGICSYNRGGLCDIALSEPLLKLRPRKDLIETLLHEMIHGFLFITRRDQDRDGHGPNFKAHMFRINKAAGLNISIYHDFHDEVELYQTHWWRCNGPCTSIRPHFGIVRRTSNRAPGPHDYWWMDHQRKCGGNFIKIKEPEPKRKSKKENKINNGDITKYITKDNNIIDNPIVTIPKPLKDSNLNKPRLSNINLVVSKKNNIIFNPKITKPVLNDKHPNDITQNSSDVVMTVRNVWASKILSPSISSSNVTPKNANKRDSTVLNPKPGPEESQPKKIMKIDDYFSKTASNILKDIYGQDFNITQSEKDNKLISVPINLVNCPICDAKINSDKINNHLDECLNKDVGEIISQNEDNPVICSNKIENRVRHDSEVIDLTNIEFETPKNEIHPLTKVSKISDVQETTDAFEDMEYFDNITLDEEEKILSGSSKLDYKCPCCGKETKSIEEHLDQCLAFFDDPTLIPEEGASTSYIDTSEVDVHDESLTLNASGTMSPCPCCMKMVEMADMNNHLDNCLSSSFSQNFDDT
ncbi:unnamed protein product [Pieris macdunnoughi]|uniref:Protein with SprT-like domain at the N terminus n=1 Tax=Pieris macdunnoughi TaxID=345717 RepID=A0A821UP07_9NEOP|nr:unnamed protein product [Pieris macdunnoughi]